MTPNACCFKTNFHEGTATGKIQDLFDFKDVYVVGDADSKKGVIVIFTDFFGNTYNNNQLICEAFSKEGYYVLMPDLFEGDAAELSMVMDENKRNTWFSRHQFNMVSPYASKFLATVKSELKPKNLFGVGHCYGAKFVLQNLSAEGPLDAGAVAHPSGTDLEEVEKITKPVIISAAEEDPVFVDEVRIKTQEILKKNKVFYQFDQFGGTFHGFAVRGDLKDPKQKYAIEKTMSDHIYWFNYHSS